MLDLMITRAEKFISSAVPPQEDFWQWHIAGAIVYALCAIAYAIADLADATRKK